MKAVHLLKKLIPNMTVQTEVPAAAILELAAALDRRDFAFTELQMRTLIPEEMTATERRLLVTFWWRVWSDRLQGAVEDFDRAYAWFAGLEKAIVSRETIWPLLRMSSEVERILGAEEISHSLAVALWSDLPDLDFGIQYETVSRVFAGGNAKLLCTLVEHLMRSSGTFVPDFWQFQGLARRWTDLGGETVEARTELLLRSTRRSDLKDLFAIYLALLRQANVSGALDAAEKLKNPLHRDRVASYLLGASQTNARIGDAVRLHDLLSDPADVEGRRFMQTRYAVATEDWDKVFELSNELLDHPDQRNAVVCLRAAALAHRGDHENAKAAIDHVRFSPAVPWFLRGRASLIGMTQRIIADGGVPVQKLSSPALRPTSGGKPLAQSLWIGPRLRWIEQLSMKSFLLNGWRYKLFAYDAPEDVPDGVELCDASSILPRSMIFREGDGSGAHKGSLGAFSDLFRYALLSKLGGLWTDTDVINLRSFETAGERLIASEWTDAGLVGPNGAMMAAPANDQLQRTALERSLELIEAGDMHFARIGPELLAELIGQQGVQGYRILPPHFMNPVGWMETGRLLESFKKTRSIDVLQSAHNLHVYTETWRLIGLDLSEPPRKAGFLPELYKRVMNANGVGPSRVLEILNDGS
jgi:hypothetical protein